ncbi:hypothetical protein LTR36_002470 [Oleoguttula mirabilis]|uniref:Nephrocystin 3-like N-terminal domain-containing protein n=1 Tax=Oleoguttula mirabilis TaxID=1507867 RepID=A0AAV9JKR0_9PEZI|nr:hypothetical protein LTR36_002470 [Oleoguttula mirabilis]
MAKTFESLQWIVVELTRSAAKKGPMAFLKQESYAGSLRTSLDEVEKLSDQFDRIAMTCDRAKLHNVEKVAISTKDQIGVEHLMTNARVAQTGEAVVSELKSYLNGMAQQFKTDVASHLMAFLGSQIDSRQQILTEQAPQPLKVLSKAQRMLKQAEQQRKRTERRAAILASLQYGGAELRRDLEENLEAISTSADRVHYLVAEPQLMNWLIEPSNAVLLVNGNCAASERNTSTSFIAAKLVETIAIASAGRSGTQYGSIGLYFFCAEHFRSHADRLAGPAGLLRSFIGELLSSSASFKLRQTRKTVLTIDLSDMVQLWAMFETLVAQLPTTVVLFCILDSITEYEMSDRRPETEYLVGSLIALSRRNARAGGCVVKVLLTCPLTSRSLHYSLEPWEVIDVPDQAPAVGGFADSAWAASGVAGLLRY